MQIFGPKLSPWSLNSMANNSKNCQEDFIVVVQDRWLLNSSGH